MYANISILGESLVVTALSFMQYRNGSYDVICSSIEREDFRLSGMAVVPRRYSFADLLLHIRPATSVWTASISCASYSEDLIGYVPGSFGHFIENTGNTTLQFLEIFNSGKTPLSCFLGASF